MKSHAQLAPACPSLCRLFLPNYSPTPKSCIFGSAREKGPDLLAWPLKSLQCHTAPYLVINWAPRKTLACCRLKQKPLICPMLKVGEHVDSKLLVRCATKCRSPPDDWALWNGNAWAEAGAAASYLLAKHHGNPRIWLEEFAAIRNKSCLVSSLGSVTSTRVMGGVPICSLLENFFS